MAYEVSGNVRGMACEASQGVEDEGVKFFRCLCDSGSRDVTNDVGELGATLS